MPKTFIHHQQFQVLCISIERSNLSDLKTIHVLDFQMVPGLYQSQRLHAVDTSSNKRVWKIVQSSYFSAVFEVFSFRYSYRGHTYVELHRKYRYLSMVMFLLLECNSYSFSQQANFSIACGRFNLKSNQEISYILQIGLNQSKKSVVAFCMCKHKLSMLVPPIIEDRSYFISTPITIEKLTLWMCLRNNVSIITNRPKFPTLTGLPSNNGLHQINCRKSVRSMTNAIVILTLRGSLSRSKPPTCVTLCTYFLAQLVANSSGGAIFNFLFLDVAQIFRKRAFITKRKTTATNLLTTLLAKW